MGLGARLGGCDNGFKCITFLPQPELEGQRENGLEAIRKALAETRASLGIGGWKDGRRECVTFNSRTQPVARESDDLSFTDVSSQLAFIIGNEASLGKCNFSGVYLCTITTF